MITLIMLIAGLTLTLSNYVQAEESSDAAIECGESDIYYNDNPNLTRAEKLSLMEKALFESLNRFDLCMMTQAESSANQDAENSAQGQNGSQNGSEESNSVASQDIQGTEPEGEASQPLPSPSGSQQSPNNQNLVEVTGSADNGAIPEDIPAAANDDAIAAQIRRAAEAEQDPEIKQKLWNEYRKYKGIEVVED